MRSHPDSQPSPMRMGVMYEDVIGPGDHSDTKIAAFLVYDGLITLMSAAGIGCSCSAAPC
ncbi:hypothetical protein AB0O76_19110 [Streptomyces sp. NPDC086554]|uniref:hypothetical protein n=1 Tax=Streptomyces sp. NPDC086554 TaxID=3154864 RepID=UPI0034240238